MHLQYIDLLTISHAVSANPWFHDISFYPAHIVDILPHRHLASIHFTEKNNSYQKHFTPQAFHPILNYNLETTSFFILHLQFNAEWNSKR